MTSGYEFIIQGGAVYWSEKCQEIISPPMTKSENIVAGHAAKEAL